MKKFIAFLITLAVLVSAVAVYTHLKAKSETLVSVPVIVEAGKEIVIKHPQWQDVITFEKHNRFYRNTNADWGTVMSFQDGVLSISWDNWGVENFKETEPDVFELIQE